MAHGPIEHAADSKEFHLFDALFGGVTIHLPSINLFGYHFQITKFMVLQVIAALLIIVIYVPIARRARDGGPPRGYFWNCFESILTFIRNEVAHPYIGHHEGDKYVPFLWTVFLFILFNNLLGMIPFLGSATGSIVVTLILAACAFVVIHGGSIAHLGIRGYVKHHIPHTGMPLLAALPIVILIVAIEVFGHFLKAFVLSVRLFANIFAGHTVLAFIMYFIVMAQNSGPLMQGAITIGSVLGVAALSLLELFVAFLQAYIFTFLTALFLGMQVHAEH